MLLVALRLISQMPLLTPKACYSCCLRVYCCFVHCYFKAWLYMPKCLRDSVVVPIPNNLSVSDNYRPVSLASSLSKILEHIILAKYSHYLSSNQLQFGFKPGCSTSLCTGVEKNIVSRYIFTGSTVFSCFLDASKAFDLVNSFQSYKIGACLLQFFHSL